MTSLNYLHREISRMEAEKLLLAAKEDGSFLIRTSETIPGGYTLCVLYQGRVHQYRILPDKEGRLYVQAEKGVQERKFIDLIQLTHEYQHRGGKNGLVCALKRPIKSEGNDYEMDSEDDDKHGSPYELDEEEEANDLNSVTETFATRVFLQRFAQLDLSSCDGEFINSLKQYLDNGIVQDVETVTSGGETLKQLQKLLAKSATEIERQVDDFMGKLEVLGMLFGPRRSSPPTKRKDPNKDAEPTSLPELLLKLNQCKLAVNSLEVKAVRKLKELCTEEGSGNGDYTQVDIPPVPLRNSASKPVIPPATFEAKVLKHGKSNQRVTLKVDIQAGKLFSVKPNKDILDDSNVFPHDRILQLIKSTANNSHLGVKLAGRKKETYVFEDVRQRENFCQLVQQLKNMHSLNQEVDHVSVFVGTWNMGAQLPPATIDAWLKSQGTGKTREPRISLIPHDIYVIGTQESALAEKDWINKVKATLCDHLGLSLHTVSTITLWGLRLIVLVKPEYKNKISHLQQSSVKTGIANALGNKGAVGVSFQFNGTSFCFVCAHLASGHEKAAKRNQSYRDILKGLSLGPKKLSVFDTSNQFHHMFFFGDLNYRLEDLEPPEIIRRVTQSRDYSSLLCQDQLQREQDRKGAFFGFTEADITFPPTYRFLKGTKDKYVWQKVKKTGTRINAPSWCDRILWRSYPETYIMNTSYGCVETINTSDHKPVFATFDIGIMGQFVSSKGASVQSGDMKIVFETIDAEVRTSTRDNFRIQFHSACLEAPVNSKQNTLFNTFKVGYCSPKWISTQLPELKPIFDDEDYLEDQHLLVAIKTADDQESYGECVIALRSMFAIKPQPFECHLTHRGEETGFIKGMMHVVARDGAVRASKRRLRKSYELVYMDTDEVAQEMDFSTTPLPSLPMSKPAPEPKNNNNSMPLYSESMKKKTGTKSLKLPHSQKSVPKQRWSEQLYECPDDFEEKEKSQSPPVLPCRKYTAEDKVYQNPISYGDDRRKAASNSHTDPKLAGTAEKSAPVLRRPPRLGQSSLSQTSVIPMTSARVAPSGHSIMGSLPGFTENRQSEKSGGGRPSVRVSQEILDNDLYHTNDSFSSEDEVDAGPTAAPPVQARCSSKIAEHKQKDYACLKRPNNINEWLLNLALPQYINSFFQHGWDHLDFLTDMTEVDLIGMEVKNPDHRQRILASIREMNSR